MLRSVLLTAAVVQPLRSSRAVGHWKQPNVGQEFFRWMVYRDLRRSRLGRRHGWHDPGIRPAEAINYYEKVRQHLGSPTDDHVRLFMVPGMAYCAEGPGASSFDMLPALEKGVEQGEAPERIIAVKPGSDPEFSHPLFPWPEVRGCSLHRPGPMNDAAILRYQ